MIHMNYEYLMGNIIVVDEYINTHLKYRHICLQLHYSMLLSINTAYKS